MEKTLWIRKLSCGHERPTNIAFMCKKYDKPKVKENCFCRQCNEEVEIISVKKAKDLDKKQLEEVLKELK
ncbi:hypothetical protein LCGC14_2282400 [marine sediment metagenome]|uniref:Uncharacterized protein n=1 Tax=marine sediment metagenome TaxID=412755 RepID=A0A0F9CUB5_9ZZZZ